MHYSAAEEQRAADEANTFLADIDYNAIDKTQAIEQWRRDQEAAIARLPESLRDEQPPRETGDDLEITAVGHVVWQRLAKHLEAEGFTRPQDAVSYTVGWRCQ